MKVTRRKGKRSLQPLIHSELRDPAFAAEFLIASIEEGLDLQVAIRQLIKAMGTTKYAKLVKELERPNILRAVRENSNPRVDTLSKLLAPFGLRLGVVRV